MYSVFILRSRNQQEALQEFALKRQHGGEWITNTQKSSTAWTCTYMVRSDIWVNVWWLTPHYAKIECSCSKACLHETVSRTNRLCSCSSYLPRGDLQVWNNTFPLLDMGLLWILCLSVKFINMCHCSASHPANTPHYLLTHKSQHSAVDKVLHTAWCTLCLVFLSKVCNKVFPPWWHWQTKIFLNEAFLGLCWTSAALFMFHDDFTDAVWLDLCSLV